MRLKSIHGTVKVWTRHLAECPHSDAKHNDCSCPKHLYERRKGGTSKRYTLQTPSYKEACDKARELLDSWDPRLARLAALEADKKQGEVSIISVLDGYYADLRAQKFSDGYINCVRSLFGVVDADSGKLYGNLLQWIGRENLTRTPDTRIQFIAQLDSALVKKWRASWTYNDLTAAQRWGMVRSFFKWCVDDERIERNPCARIKAGRVRKGNRCGCFSDEQYAAILAATAAYSPQNMPFQTRLALPQRMRIFTELLRWSGMAIVDGVQFSPAWVDSDGVLRYRRHKTAELAIVPLPEQVIELLKDIPLEHDGVGAHMPFRSAKVKLQSDCQSWRNRFQQVFALAKITEVETELTLTTGKKIPPHPHMFRDTFAIWYLEKGKDIADVAKMLGHARTATTEQSYSQWVHSRQEAMIARVRETHVKVPPATVDIATAEAVTVQ